MPDLLPSEWQNEAVQFQPRTGRARFLVAVRRERCPYCTTGTRTVSLWTTQGGSTESVTWCGHCFNATCERVRLDVEDRVRCAAVLNVAAEGRVSRPWSAARPAVEDLERRGLL